MGARPEAADLKHQLLLRADRRREKQPVEDLGPRLPVDVGHDGRGGDRLVFIASRANENLMQRRTFISAIGAVALTGSHPAAAQQAAKVPRTGFLAMDLTSGNRQFREAFFRGLRS
jgi:hypothetical protein